MFLLVFPLEDVDLCLLKPMRPYRLPPRNMIARDKYEVKESEPAPCVYVYVCVCVRVRACVRVF